MPVVQALSNGPMTAPQRVCAAMPKGKGGIRLIHYASPSGPQSVAAGQGPMNREGGSPMMCARLQRPTPSGLRAVCAAQSWVLSPARAWGTGLPPEGDSMMS